MSSFKVIIIGAGLAGSALANGLMRHEIDVQVYERLPQDSKREGYQIRLGAHALRGLRACLSQDELQRIVAKFGPANGSKSEAPIVVNRNFETVLDLSKFPSYNKSAPISRVVLRDALAEPVATAGKLKYDTKFDKYEILNPNMSNERVRVWFEDGSHDDCDILVAADGSHSKVGGYFFHRRNNYH
jgi:2-polyprenyl-6-methoxyphenol hydroxylase-like FAD-dependent oxidoreductase